MTRDSSSSGRSKTFDKYITKSLSKAKYRHSEPSRREMLDALKTYRGLAPSLEKFVFDDGEEKSLLNLNGTIPIKYRGCTYNIPVYFWLRPDYPDAAPMGFVKPTADMTIKASENVDSNGRVSLPYLDDWKGFDSSLMEFISICVLVFSENPPVFSKARSASASNAAAASDSDLREEKVKEEHLRMSLLTAVEEKVRSKLDEEFLKTKAEVESLHSTNKELLDGQEKINDIVAELEWKCRELEVRGEKLEDSGKALEEAGVTLTEVADAAKEEPDTTVLISGGSLHRQLVDAFSTDSALDDAIYALGTALHQGTLEFDVYLKTVRKLSRKQFQQRLIINKCRQRASSSSSANSFERSYSESAIEKPTKTLVHQSSTQQ